MPISADGRLASGSARPESIPAANHLFIGVNDIALAWADGQDSSRHFDSNERREMAIEAAREIAEDIASQA